MDTIKIELIQARTGPSGYRENLGRPSQKL
jgi:hypothetical protein